MAEDLLPDLDDGELWLPSDVIRAVGSYRHRPIDAIDDLAQKLSSFDLSEQNRAIQTAKTFKDTNFLPKERRKGVSLISPVCGMVHQFHPVLPFGFQVERMRVGRARVLQRQWQNRNYEFNRFLPIRCAGSEKKSIGTGVFLPRVYRVESNKKTSSVIGNAELEKTWFNPVVGKETEKCITSLEMRLPQEWSY